MPAEQVLCGQEDFDQQTAGTSDSGGSSSATGTAAGRSASNEYAWIMMKIMQLLHAYGDTSQNAQNSATSS